MAAVASNPSTNMFFESNFMPSMPFPSTPLPPAESRSGTVPVTMPMSQAGVAPTTRPMSQSGTTPNTMSMSQSGPIPTTLAGMTPAQMSLSQSGLTPTTMPMSQSGVAPTSVPIMPNTMPMMPTSQSGMAPNTKALSQSSAFVGPTSAGAPLGTGSRSMGSAPFGTGAFYVPNAPIPSTISTTSPRQKVEAYNPYGMSEDELGTSASKVDALHEIEGVSPPEVEPSGEFSFRLAEGVQRDFLDNEADQFERRLRYLETLAGSAADGMMLDQRPQLLPRPPPRGPRWGMFDDKYIPMALGGGWNSTAYTFYKGYYVDKDKISQREAQLKHLGGYHQHPEIYWLAGIEKEEIDDEYWDRDVAKFALKARKEQMGGKFGDSGAIPPQWQCLPIEVQQRLVSQVNQQTMNNVNVRTQMNQQAANMQNIEMMSRDLGPFRSSRSY